MTFIFLNYNGGKRKLIFWYLLYCLHQVVRTAENHPHFTLYRYLHSHTFFITTLFKFAFANLVIMYYYLPVKQVVYVNFVPLKTVVLGLYLQIRKAVHL